MYKLIAVFLMWVTPALAQESAHVELTDKDIKEVEIDDQSWVAFSTEVSRKLLELNIKFPLLEKQIESLTELNMNRASEINILNNMNQNLTSQISLLTQKNKSLLKQINEQDEFWYKFWKSPYLWFCVGLVIGGTATVITIQITK